MTSAALTTAKGIAVCGALAATIIIGSSYPTHAQMGQKEGAGTFTGALIGGAIGSMFGGGVGERIVGGVVGAAIGGMIGNRIGASLDEQDRIALARATRNAFATGRTQRFSGRAGRGTAHVLSSSNVNGQPCRTVRQEFVLKDGTVLTDELSGCRGPNGWKV